jgi:hypothetical protein
MKEYYEDNIKKDLNFQNTLCILVFYSCITVFLYGL